MKKFLAALLATWCLAASVAFAGHYPRFWKGDTNYPLVWGRRSEAVYLDKNSVTVKLNAPPYYIITARTVSIYPSDYTEEIKYSNDKDPRSPNDFDSYEFFYDEDEADMRVGDSSISNWMYLRPQDGDAMRGRRTYIGEAVFYVATGRKFYGNYLWKAISTAGGVLKDEQGNDKYWDMFDDKWYEDLR